MPDTTGPKRERPSDILTHVTKTRTNEEKPWQPNEPTTHSTQETTMPIDESYYCDCGHIIHEGWNYCPECGKPTGNNTEWGNEYAYYYEP